jgi:hypothetical protein
MKMGLFKPKWMNPNESVADSAVRKLTKEADLINAALKSPHKRVRRYAASRIKDQRALFRIVAADEDAYVRISATVGLKDQELLAQTAVQNSDSDIRRIASEKLTNQAVLKEIVLKDQDNKVRIAAIGQLTDQSVLKEIIHKKGHVAAIGQLTDEAAIREIIQKEPDKMIRIAAIARLTDEEELIRIVKNDPLRKYAAKRLRELAAERGKTLGDMVDQTALMNLIAQSKRGCWDFESAIMLLEEHELLRLIQQEPFADGGWFALNQLQDQEALKRIINESGCNTKKARALGRLLQVAEWDSVDIDEDFMQHMLEYPLEYSDCLKQIYQKTRKYAEQIKKLNTHFDHGYHDSCHEDTHYDISTRMDCGFD